MEKKLLYLQSIVFIEILLDKVVYFYHDFIIVKMSVVLAQCEFVLALYSFVVVMTTITIMLMFHISLQFWVILMSVFISVGFLLQVTLKGFSQVHAGLVGQANENP